jgi:fucose 4-O-acetylase-like acetyltransferase
MSTAPTNRNDFADYLKGVLIFLVACGHLIQFVGYQGQPPYYLNPLFKAIYTFHMPLFMAVSGYVSFHSLNHSGWLQSVGRRLRQVIVPAVCWPPLYLLAKFLIFIWLAGSVAGGRESFRNFLVDYRPAYWFLYAVFVATVAVATLKKIRADRVQFFALLTGLMLFAPEGACFYLVKYTFPFFCLGYALAKGDQIRLPEKNSGPVLTVLLLASAACYWLWTKDTYVYVTRMRPTFANLPNIALRWVAGGVISAAVVALTYWFHQRVKSPLLSRWGRRSLDIYIIHIFFVEILEAWLHPAPDSLWFCWLAVPVLAGILCWVSFFAGDGLGRIPVLRALLLGRMAPALAPSRPPAA